MSALASSKADVWHLKSVLFPPGAAASPVKIITQNFNGPCSFIAICNILILRRQIEILPHERATVSYELLAQLLGDYLLTNCPDVDISAALSIMPTTTKGLDLNPQFTGITAFSPAADPGELDLFAQAGIQLVHGWLVDPDSPEADVMSRIRDYDSAVTLIADADYITKGKLLGHADAYPDVDDNTAGPNQPSASSTPGPSAHVHTAAYSDDQRRKIEHALVAQQFLDATQSQLTYHGLFQLASTLEPGALVALFRNAHLSVVYKPPGAHHPVPTSGPDSNAVHPPPSPTETPGAALYTLVTDDVFLHEPAIVWERLDDIDNASTFVDSNLVRAVPVGGDVAGDTADAALRRLETEAGLCGVVDPADQELARQLQAEEDARAREAYHQRQQAIAARRRSSARGQAVQGAEDDSRRRGQHTRPSSSVAAKSKKPKNCVMM